MVINKSSHLALQLLALLFFSATSVARSGPCARDEWGALNDLKKGLDDPSGRLASWVGDECCSWPGVGCDNRTGRVVRIDLQVPDSNGYSQLSGAFSSSMIYLEDIEYLDLSGNDFRGAPIPEFLGSFKKLIYLNLSGAEFSGTVPPQLGNLSGLRYLDLSGNSLSDDSDGNIGWMQALGSLNPLEFLSLSGCGLSSIPQSLPHESFNSLSFLDLSSNKFNSSVPDWLFNITSLKHLDLSANSFNGPIPSSVGRMSSLNFLDISDMSNVVPIPKELGDLCNLRTLDVSRSKLAVELIELETVFSGCMRNSLEYLDLTDCELTGNLPDWLGGIKNLKSLYLRGNSIYGSIPDSLGRLSYLQTFDVSGNQLNGTIAETVGQLSSLVSLSLSGNSLNGVLSEAHFSNLTQLQVLDLSSNSLSLHVASDWVPPFQLEYIALGPCKLGPRFPQWLQTQDKVSYLDLSHTAISDSMPEWFWSLTSRINYLDLSNNQISGRLPNSLVLGNGDFVQVYLNSNNFYGPLPRVPSNVARLKLSNNSFSGQIPASISDTTSILEMLSLSMNNLTGTLPSSICKLQKLYYLDAANNHLSGDFPNCWNRSSKFLQGLDFSNNNFSGTLPSSICLLPSLVTLHLRNSGLTGELLSSLKNCINLVTLDLGFNQLIGEIPTWLGESLTNLKILSLRSNFLSGIIPPQLSQLAYLQILDLSHNNLSGTIPRSFGNFSAMKVVQSSLAPILTSFINFNDYMLLNVKGMEQPYEGLLSLLRVINLSDNNLAGHIPAELANLVGLHSLNLSMNHLTGEITEDIGKLSQLMSLDLSRNEISGAIPPSLATLTFLDQLNLSYNELSGKIPSGSQLQALPYPSIYMGNIDLCGFPLPRKCGSDDEALSPVSPIGEDEEGKLENEIDWTIVGLAPGFVVGISIVSWILLFHKERRDAYFKLIDNVYDNLPFVTKKMNDFSLFE